MSRVIPAPLPESRREEEQRVPERRHWEGPPFQQLL